MIVMLVALTFLGFISVHAIAKRAARKREISRVKLEKGRMVLCPVPATPRSGTVPYFPEDIYYHPGHAWARLEQGNRIKIGVDDFTQQVMGNIDDIELPHPGAKLNQGEVAWKVRHGNRKLNQLAPLGGIVVEVNERLRKDPTLANRSPYEEGWVLKIQTKALNREMPKLMDSFQFRARLDQDKGGLISCFDNQTLGLAYGDGGEVIKGVAGKVDEKTWKLLVTQLFHSSPENHGE